MERARRQVRGVRATSSIRRGRGTLARPPSDLALSRRRGSVRQHGVVARELPPTDSRAKVMLANQAAFCEGRCTRLEPYEAEVSCTVLRGAAGGNTRGLPDAYNQ